MSGPPPQPADATPPLTVFIATSRRFYMQAEALCEVLRARGHRVFHPYFDRDARAIEADPELKVAVTREHFPELDASDVVYALLPGGYTGTSVAMSPILMLPVISIAVSDGREVSWQLLV